VTTQGRELLAIRQGDDESRDWSRGLRPERPRGIPDHSSRHNRYGDNWQCPSPQGSVCAPPAGSLDFHREARRIVEGEQRRDRADFPRLAVFCQAGAKQRANSRGHISRYGGPIGIEPDDCAENVGHVAAIERPRACQHFIEHAAERPHVRAPIGWPAFRLLRRHVGCGTEQHADAGQQGGRGQRRRFPDVRDCLAVVTRSTRLNEPGQPEIQNLDGTVLADFDVRRLQIAVDDALLVRRGESVGKLPGDVQRLAHRKPRTPSQFFRQRRSLDQFEDQSQIGLRGRRISKFFLGVNRTDVGMVQRRQRARLAFQPRQALGIPGEGFRQDLDRDVPTEACVARAVHLAHAAGAEGRSNLVDAKTGAGVEGHECRKQASYGAIAGVSTQGRSRARPPKQAVAFSARAGRGVSAGSRGRA